MSGMSRVGKRANAFENNGKLKKIHKYSLVCVHMHVTWVVVPESYLYVRGWVSDVWGVEQAATQTHFLGMEPAVRDSVTLCTALQ